MALLFTLLLGISAVILGYLLVSFGQQEFLHTPEAAEHYARFKTLSLLIMALMLIVVLVSFGISHFVVSRIRRIAQTARSIMETGDLSKRISIDSNWDDLSGLSQVLNQLLAQIESLMTSVREVSNNIAHDLRTPLTSLRHEIEALKHHPRSDHQVDALLAEADRILSIFHSLLRITNIEKGKRHHPLKAVDLHIILRDVTELYEPLAEEKSIAFVTSLKGKALIKGDQDLLFQLFANLLDNAIKFSPSGSRVNVSSEVSEEAIRVRVEDHGLGIPQAEYEHVFRHFYRSDQSRSTPGNGLGLSLVKAVIDQHRAHILLEDNQPGLRVTTVWQPYQ